MQTKAEVGAPGPSGQVDQGLENQAGTRAGWENGEMVVGVGRVKARLQICWGGERPPSLPIGTTLLSNRLLGVIVDREEEIQNSVSMRL